MSYNSHKDTAIAAAEVMDSKGATDVAILKMHKVMAETDFFVICSCSSFTQMRAVCQAVLDSMDKMGVKLRSQEGRNDNKWILLDYGDLIIHIFLDSQREYYNLEKLWADAETIHF